MWILYFPPFPPPIIPLRLGCLNNGLLDNIRSRTGRGEGRERDLAEKPPSAPPSCLRLAATYMRIHAPLPSHPIPPNNRTEKVQESRSTKVKKYNSHEEAITHVHYVPSQSSSPIAQLRAAPCHKLQHIPPHWLTHKRRLASFQHPPPFPSTQPPHSAPPRPPPPHTCRLVSHFLLAHQAHQAIPRSLFPATKPRLSCICPPIICICSCRGASSYPYISIPYLSIPYMSS